MYFAHDTNLNFYYYGDKKPYAGMYRDYFSGSPTGIIGLDTETVSLKDRTVIGVGIAVEPNTCFYFPLLPEQSPVVPWRLLQSISVTKVLHNCLFDLTCMRELDDTNIQDTSMMSRLARYPTAKLSDLAPLVDMEIWEIKDILPKGQTMLDVEQHLVAKKCMLDAGVTLAVYHKLKPEVDAGYLSIEMQLIPILLKMSFRGILLDQEARQRLEDKVQAEVDHYRSICDEAEFNPSSPKQVGDALANRGAYAVFKRLPFTRGSNNLATGAKILEKMVDPMAATVLEYRAKSKLLSTYIKPWAKDTRAYTRFHLDAITGRISSTDRNLQNIPQGVTRGIFLPDSGVFTDIDYSQVELRVLAYLSGDKEMEHIFSLPKYNTDGSLNEAADIHQQTSNFMGIERRLAKNVNFAMIYGATNETIADTAKIKSIARAKQLKDMWFEKYREAGDWIQTRQEEAFRTPIAYTLFGREIRLPSIEDEGAGSIMRKAVNYPIQGCIPSNNRILIYGKGYIPIKSVLGQTVKLWDGTNYVTGTVMPSGYKPEVVITLASKQKIICSPDHLLLVMNSRGSKLWKTPLELVGKDQYNLCITDNVNNPDGDISIPSIPNTTHWKAPHGVHNTNILSFSMIANPYRLGIVLGRLASDGSIGQDRALRWLIAEHEKEIIPYLKDILAVFPVKETTTIRNTRQNMHQLDIYSVMLARQAIDMGLKHKIPDIAWCDKELLRGFLCGMFDGDGGISGNGIVLTFGKPSVATQYPEDIQKALLLFGIRSTVARIPYCIHVRVRTRDNLLFKKEIGFINTKKQQAIPILTSVKSGWKSERIRSIKVTGNYLEMFDVLNTDSGKFMTEGFVTHNSAAEILKRALIMCKGLPMCLQVHDEILIDKYVPEEELEHLQHIAPFHTPISITYLERWE